MKLKDAISLTEEEGRYSDIEKDGFLIFVRDREGTKPHFHFKNKRV